MSCLLHLPRFEKCHFMMPFRRMQKMFFLLAVCLALCVCTCVSALIAWLFAIYSLSLNLEHDVQCSWMSFLWPLCRTPAHPDTGFCHHLVPTVAAIAPLVVVAVASISKSVRSWICIWIVAMIYIVSWYLWDSAFHNFSVTSPASLPPSQLHRRNLLLFFPRPALFETKTLCPTTRKFSKCSPFFGSTVCQCTSFIPYLLLCHLNMHLWNIGRCSLLTIRAFLRIIR